jgi:hypothetical protein
MTDDHDSASFEGFLRWLQPTRRPGASERLQPNEEVLAAARQARREHQALQTIHQEELRARCRTGTYYEEVELMAAADSDPTRPIPRLRTPQGFAICALYALNSLPEAPPVGLLVECPEGLIDVFKGYPVQVLAGGRWVALGEIDVEGKAFGDLPEGVQFKPPFGFRVGEVEESPKDLSAGDPPPDSP